MSRNLAGAGGTLWSAEVDSRQGCSTEKIKKEPNNPKREKFMICKYSCEQFQFNAFLSKTSSSKIQSTVVLGRKVLFIYIKFLSFLEGKTIHTLLWNYRHCRIFHAFNWWIYTLKIETIPSSFSPTHLLPMHKINKKPQSLNYA